APHSCSLSIPSAFILLPEISDPIPEVGCGQSPQKAIIMMPYLSCKKIENDVYNFPTWQYCKYKDIFDSRIIINSTAKFYISISYQKDLLSIDTRIFTPSTFLDNIEKTHGLYSPPALGLAAAIACCGFTFLLGGGPIEMFCAFVGAGIGNYLRCKLTKHHFTLFLCIVSSVSLACFAYAGLLKLGEILFGISVQHEAGYICAMLFIIPGFPFITSGIDLAKLDMRSGIERLTYALIVILVATMSAWIMALILHLKPVDFIKLSLSTEQWILFRLLASFCGVFGFSIMFNSPVRLAVAAAGIGAVANTLRLELVDLANIPPAAAAFIGALTAGLLASLLKNKVGYPRISVTVPSIVIMVPGLYLYRGFYNLGIMSLSVAASWFASAILIIAALPLGLIFARILTDKAFRYCT
ncbi:threonine/serine ThrE exporter family protein, partial [Blautia wexlerae]|uniref:threonine/serine ThrE exporter family protein n=1 Tax=Blautia wexlerae TaxID=418240 RepID=UPI001FA80A17